MLKTIRIALVFIIIPFILLLSVYVMNAKHFALVSMFVALVGCLPFFLSFEEKKTPTKELVLIATMIVINVVARIGFVWIPHFKPVTALVIIAGIAFGKDAGFIIGAFTALISNIYFGQGPWTPFQMFAWGIIGYGAGMFFHRQEQPKWIPMIIYSVLSSLLFGVIMEIWTVLAFQEGWNWSRFIALLLTSGFILGMYVLSTFVFLLVFYQPFMDKMKRLKTKYGIFSNR